MNLPLQARAEQLGRALPPLLARAQELAATAMLGEHGRRRAGPGDEFWQYRAAHPGDAARAIDWRRSARSDALFVREHEWQAAQSVTLWVDAGRSMSYSGASGRPPKLERVRLLALALAVLLLRGGERVGLAGGGLPRAGQAQAARLAAALEGAGGEPEGEARGGGAADGSAAGAEHGAPGAVATAPRGWVVMLSDFLGPEAALRAAVLGAADAGSRGVLMQVLDPVEEAFPFAGRVVFESMTGALRHETREAAGLRSRYLAALADRRARLDDLCRAVGWSFSTHHTGTPAQAGLLWLYHALGQAAPGRMAGQGPGQVPGGAR